MMSKDWDALAHVKFLREQGGPSSGYTADLIEKMASALMPFADYVNKDNQPGLSDSDNVLRIHNAQIVYGHLRAAKEFF